MQTTEMKWKSLLGKIKKKKKIYIYILEGHLLLWTALKGLTFVLLNLDMPCLYKQCRSRQLASEEANWSGSTLFVIQYVNLYQLSGLSNLIGWQ